MDTLHYKGLYFNNGIFSEVSDVLATEEALTVSINEVQFTVTMRSPGNELELLQGLLFTEGIFKHRMEPHQLKVNSFLLRLIRWKSAIFKAEKMH